jgi:putative endonuclease
MSFAVYILKCSDDSLYVGSTNDIEKRIHAHNHLKSGARYTKARRPVQLIYTKICETFKEARQREYRIKCLKREQKLELIKNHPVPIAGLTQS